mgnify:CR=1 FL=1
MIKCMDCFGRGIQDTDRKSDCGRCDGTGEVADEMKLWIMRGNSLRRCRLSRRLSVFDLAEMLNIRPHNIVETEWGYLSPTYSLTDILNAAPAETMTLLEKLREAEVQ